MEQALAVVGINHQTASVSSREALAPRSAEAGRLNAVVREAAGLPDAVVLATCSRFEVYASTDEAGVARLKEYLSARAGRPLGAEFYARLGPAAVEHAFRVAAGLDSWILGESEILGQVKAAYQAACQESTATRPLHLTFQRALFVGKKVRTETSIVGGINSIGGAAALLARRIFARVEERRLLVFGAGSMAASTVRHLRAKGMAEVWVANRSLERAQGLAAEWGALAMSLEEGLRRLREADVAVFSTGATEFLLTEAAARAVSAERGGRPLFLIDLGLPRNVDPAAAGAGGVFLYDMESLRGLVEESLRRRETDLARASAIVAAESADCWSRIVPPPQTQAEPRPLRCPLRQAMPNFRTA